MTTFSAVTRAHVLTAVAEYDERGDEEFLTEYALERTRGRALRHDGKSYDSTAVLGAAQWHATGKPATRADFAADKDGVASVLAALGFDVAAASPASDGDDLPAGGQWVEAGQIGDEAAHEAWADAAHAVLVDTAKSYHSVITHKDLAAVAQSRSGVRSSQLAHYWIGGVLRRITATCAERGEPLLASLCVNASGSVGDGYALAVQSVRGEVPPDPDEHASRERLACHHYFGAELPAGGGSPALTPQVSAARTRARKARALEKPVTLCPKCHMQMPVAAACNYCD